MIEDEHKTKTEARALGGEEASCLGESRGGGRGAREEGEEDEEEDDREEYFHEEEVHEEEGCEEGDEEEGREEEDEEEGVGRGEQLWTQLLAVSDETVARSGHEPGDRDAHRIVQVLAGAMVLLRSCFEMGDLDAAREIVQCAAEWSGEGDDDLARQTCKAAIAAVDARLAAG